MLSDFRRLARRYIPILLLAFAMPLAGCAGLPFAAPSETAKRCTAWQTPNAYVGCLAEDLTQVAKDYEADSRAGKMSEEAFLAARPGVLAARAALNDAGALLNAADTTRKLATQPDAAGGKATALNAAAAAIEAIAIGRAAVADDKIKWLAENLQRLRAPPAAVLVPPTPLKPAG